MRIHEPRLRFPGITLLVVCVSVLQLWRGYRWELYGYSHGWSRLWQSLWSVLTHTDASHLLSNTAGLLLGAGLLEMLRGHRWVIAAFFIAGVDGFFFVGSYTVVCGASGMVMAGMAGCVMLVPQAFAMARDERSGARARLSYLAAQLGVIVAPVGLIDDVLRLGDESGVNHGAHIRGAAGGLVIGVVGMLCGGSLKRCEEAPRDESLCETRDEERSELQPSA